MKNFIPNLSKILVILSCIMISGCTNNGPTKPDDSNKAPVANAGVDGAIALPSNTYMLDGSGMDPEGSVLKYEWSGPAGVTFSSSMIADPTVTFPSQVGSYTFTLTVSDDGSPAKSGTDQVTISVNPSTIQATKQLPINLRSDADFVVLAGSKVSNIPTSSITGDVGLSPAAGSKITGFGLTEITGKVFTVDASGPAGSTPDAPGLTSAKGDLTIAYNEAAGRTSIDLVLLAGNIGGLTLTPGLYKSTGSLEISSGNLTLDANGDQNAVFIIQIASTLTTTSGRQVILSGGAKAANIYWQVGTSATLGTTSVFKGNIMADQSISVKTGAIIEGRLLARIAAITLSGNTITKPAP